MKKIDKITKGQFFTKEDYWLKDKPQIIDFINENLLNKNTILDPFYGRGDLFLTLDKMNLIKDRRIIGLDIEKEFLEKNKVFYNDSLTGIPDFNLYNSQKTFVITNPPYLAKVSAKRKGLDESVNKYYEQSGLNDLYKIALKNLIEFGAPGIAIVPESFINSKFFIKIRKNINIITSIIPNPFKDTDIPICVVCFNGKNGQETEFFINENYAYKFNEFVNLKNRVVNNHDYQIKFNSFIGQIGLKAIDSSNHRDIAFVKSNQFRYSTSKIKVSSRMMTYLHVDEKILNNIDLDEIIYIANNELNNFRNETRDLVFTPFRGNIDNNHRRRRLDYKTARWLLEKTINKIYLKYEQEQFYEN